MSLEDQILQAIRARIPSIAEIRVIPGINSLGFGVSWKLNDDPERPNKMSKTVSICVSHEAAEDFANASAANQDAAYMRVSEFLSEKLSHFDPQHNAPRRESPPNEKWVITSEIVLGQH